jgi:beta-lactamase class D
MRRNVLMLATFFSLFLTTITMSADAAEWEESARIGRIFKSAGVNGTFVLYDVVARKDIGHNRIRAEKRYLPASTFKIPNSLIGLFTGAVNSVDEVLPYTGPPNPYIKAWGKDMALREAIRLSNVPIYQELARRIGLERMRDGLERLDYGNKEIGPAVDTFWLKGPLKISAVEQTRFLASLAQGTLPFPKALQESVQEISLLDQGSNWKLYGKTGWENAPGQGVGWWVGWVQKDGRVYAFALNMDILKEADGSKRMELGRASLKALEIF